MSLSNKELLTMEKSEENKDKIQVGNDGFGFDEGSTYKKSEVFQVESSDLSTKPDFKQFAKETCLIIKLGAEKPERVIREKIEHVWNTHVVPLQEELKSTVDEKWEVISDADKTIKQLQADNKLLREEIERFKAEKLGTVPRMFRCSSTACTWPNCDCSKL